MLKNKELLKFSKDISVLYAEDEEMIRNQYKAIFDLFFKEVMDVENGLDALEKYKNKHYDLLITDLTMPKMDGVALIKKILEINPDQHVIIMTAHNTSENLRSSIDFQVDGFLLKPVEKDKLFQLFSKVCRYINNEKRENFIENKEDSLDNFPLDGKQDLFVVVVDKLDEIIKEFGMEVREPILNAVKEHLSNFGIENDNTLKIHKGAVVFTTHHAYLNNLLEIMQDFSHRNNNIIVEFYNLKIHITLSYGFIMLKDKKSNNNNYLYYIESMIDEIKDNEYGTDIVKMDIAIEEAKKIHALKWLNTTLDVLKQKMIVPFYQSTVDINKLQTKFYEIYIRIKQDGSYVLPKFFVDLSEKAGISKDISRIAFELAFERLATTKYSFHINLVNRDLKDNSIVEYLFSLCSRFNIEPQRIIVNIYSKNDIQVNGRRVNTILKLKELGFKIALKGFIEGSVNIELLSTIQPDYIKINQLLLQKSLVNKPLKLILFSLLQIASKSNIETILYNVEDEKILNEGRKLGFDYVQGYLIAKPSDVLVEDV